MVCILIVVVEVIYFVYEKGIIYCDLKFSNILFDVECCFYVVDFGLVCDLYGEVMMMFDGELLGMLVYMFFE